MKKQVSTPKCLYYPKDGGHRAIINLKKLNKFVKPQHLKVESIHMLRDILKRGDYMTQGRPERCIFHGPNIKVSPEPNDLRCSLPVHQRSL